jgi:hypothetical protein
MVNGVEDMVLEHYDYELNGLGFYVREINDLYGTGGSVVLIFMGRFTFIGDQKREFVVDGVEYDVWVTNVDWDTVNVQVNNQQEVVNWGQRAEIDGLWVYPHYVFKSYGTGPNDAAKVLAILDDTYFTAGDEHVVEVEGEEFTVKFSLINPIDDKAMITVDGITGSIALGESETINGLLIEVEEAVAYSSGSSTGHWVNLAFALP